MKRRRRSVTICNFSRSKKNRKVKFHIFRKEKSGESARSKTLARKKKNGIDYRKHVEAHRFVVCMVIVAVVLLTSVVIVLQQ